MDDNQIAEFIRCGVLKATPFGEEPKMPYDHAALMRMVGNRRGS